MKKNCVYIDSVAWVCETNLIGCSRIYRYLIENSCRMTNNPSEADYIIINSCGLTEHHTYKCLNLYKKYNSLKKEKAKIILYGCLVKIKPELIESLDVYSIHFDNEEKFDKIFYRKIKFEDIKPYCDSKVKQGLLDDKNPFYRTKIFPFLLSGLIMPLFRKVRSNYKKNIENVSYENKIFLEISRGCTGNCSYCVIKRARGKICSRKIEDLIEDIKKMYDPSKKLFLVANDCGCYGLDIKTNLIELLYEINKKFPNLMIELNYLNPQWLEKKPDEYIKLFKDVKIDFVVIPMQSGSDKIVKNMNRHYNVKNVIKIVDKIKKVSPKIFIYSHFIIGYPGENTIDFLKSLIYAMHFDFPIGFEYSNHEGTASASLSNHKSSLTITIRYFLYLVFLNFFLFYKLLSQPKNLS
ncbi:MAG: radical SAM protein [Promethearchaeota archaeon]